MSNKATDVKELTKSEKEKVKAILSSLESHQDIPAFLIPVKNCGLPKEIYNSYKALIKEPMDIKTIKGKFRKSQYKEIGEFHSDVMLIWRNCQQFNTDESELFKCSVRLKKESDKLFQYHFPNLFPKEKEAKQTPTDKKEEETEDKGEAADDEEEEEGSDKVKKSQKGKRTYKRSHEPKKKGSKSKSNKSQQSIEEMISKIEKKTAQMKVDDKKKKEKIRQKAKPKPKVKASPKKEERKKRNKRVALSSPIKETKEEQIEEEEKEQERLEKDKEDQHIEAHFNHIIQSVEEEVQMNGIDPLYPNEDNINDQRQPLQPLHIQPMNPSLTIAEYKECFLKERDENIQMTACCSPINVKVATQTISDDDKLNMLKVLETLSEDSLCEVLMHAYSLMPESVEEVGTDNVVVHVDRMPKDIFNKLKSFINTQRCKEVLY